MAKARGDFTDILVQKKIIGADQIVEAKSLQTQTGAKLQDAIVKLGYASTEEVMSAIAEFHNMPFLNLTDMTIPASVVELVPESVARENVVLPHSQENGVLKIITSDPTDFATLQKLQFILNKDIQPVVAIREQIIEAINRHYGQIYTESANDMVAEFTDTSIEFGEIEEIEADAAADDSDTRIVKLVDLLITEAISLRASELHIEPCHDRVRVRYRIDGILWERDSPPRQLLDSILSRIKFMANIARPQRPQPPVGRIKRLLAPLLSRNRNPSNIARPERPQSRDGRIKMNVEGKQFDLRVGILPTGYGESAVLRIARPIRIEDLGFDQDDHQRFLQILKHPSGLFLVTGPMGSGKTTTLYAAVSELNRPDRKIVTAEDPVEYGLPGIVQWPIQRDLTFAKALQSILGQAPDIIMVGEICDQETAQMAVQAALSGRMVFGTLATSQDAPSAISRLVNMGIEPFLIASSVTAIMAQRLVRVVCPKCWEPDKPSAAEIRAAGITTERIATASFRRGRGCNYCYYTGYLGRMGIFEMFKLNAAIREMICNREPIQTICRQARRLGMRTLLEDGVHKALRGVTMLEQVLNACHSELKTDTGSGA
jgi:type IV pilus assembly protein PilB